MTRDEIIEVLKNSVSGLLKDVEVEVRVFNKNNGTTYVGFTLSKDSTGYNVSPVVDISEIVDKIVDDRLAIEKASELVANIYERNKVQFNYILNREDVLDTAFCEVINYDMNRNLLAKVPHETFLDLAIIFRFKPDIAGINGSIVITNDMLDALELDIDDVRDIAMQECLDENYICKSIGDYLFGVEYDDMPMFVCTKCNTEFGARVILNTRMLKEFGYDLFIIPSSIHEIIVIPAKYVDGYYIRDLIKTVNETEVDIKDVLSDSLYYFDLDTESLIIAD